MRTCRVHDQCRDVLGHRGLAEAGARPPVVHAHAAVGCRHRQPALARAGRQRDDGRRGEAMACHLQWTCLLRKRSTVRVKAMGMTSRRQSERSTSAPASLTRARFGRRRRQPALGRAGRQHDYNPCCTCVACHRIAQLWPKRAAGWKCRPPSAAAWRHAARQLGHSASCACEALRIPWSPTASAAR